MNTFQIKGLELMTAIFIVIEIIFTSIAAICFIRAIRTQNDVEFEAAFTVGTVSAVIAISSIIAYFA